MESLPAKDWRSNHWATLPVPPTPPACNIFCNILLACYCYVNVIATQKKFVRGLKQHGKNFFKIRRDLLSNKETVSFAIDYAK